MSDKHSPNDRSDAALRERLEIAEKATHGPWALWEWHNGVKEIKSNADPDEDHVCRVWHKKDGDFLAKNSPREVQADIEEILRLRGEVARLEKEADWLAERLHGSGYPCPGDGEKFDPYGECRERGWPCVPCFREEARKAVEEEENG